jgi:hypothetical protein
MLTAILTAVVVVAGSTAWVYIAFFALCTAKRLLKAGVKLRWGMRGVCYFLLVTGWPADVVFNLFHGYRYFREFRGVTFSSRIKYYNRHPEKCPDRAEFNYWFAVLETGDPGHVS